MNDWRNSLPGLSLPFITGALFFRNNFPGVEAGLLLTFIFNLAVCGRSRIQGRSVTIMFAMFVLMATTVLGNLLADGLKPSSLVSLLLKFFIFFALTLTSYTQVQISALVRGFIAGGVFSSLLMALNFFGFIDISPPTPHANYVEIRQSGFMGDPNVVGAFLVFSILLAHHHLRPSSAGVEAGISTALTRRVAVSIMFFGILLTFSRAAWANLVVAFILYGLLKNVLLRGGAKRLMLGLCILGFFIGVISIVRSTTPWLDIFFDRFDPALLAEATYLRVDTQTKVLASFHEADLVTMLFGHGAYSSERLTGMPPHFTPLQVLYEAGVLSFVILVVIGAMSLVRSVKCMRIKPDVLPVLAPCLIGLLVNSGAIDTFYWRLPWLMFALIVMCSSGTRPAWRPSV